MLFIDPLLGEINEDKLAPGYVFYGEEDYLAEGFIQRLKQSLISPEAQGFNVERFDLAAARWPEVIDTARTAPFFFSPWRLVVAQAVEKDRDGKPFKEDRSAFGKLSSLDEKIIREYFRSPASKTILVVVVKGRVKKSHALVRLFGTLGRSGVVLQEVRPLKEEALRLWMKQRLAALGKTATLDALLRLEEVIGNDLRRLDREFEKIAVYAGDRKTIEIEDVLQVCDWTKDFVEWDLTNALKKGDQRLALLTLNRAFQEGEEPENIVRVLARFFRDLLLAKLWLAEGRGRKEIFAFLKPQVKETFAKLYADEFRALFSLVDRLSLVEISAIVRDLERIDLSVKTTSDSVEPLVDRFVVEYCRRFERQRERGGVTSRGRG
jgi:DNA polymerase III delta subunit